MEIHVVQEEEIIPEWNDNKNEKKPIKIKVHYLTPGERDKCYEYKKGQLQPDTQMFFRYFVKEIINCKVNDIEIKTPEDILNTAGLEGLYVELGALALRGNMRKDLKNSQ